MDPIAKLSLKVISWNFVSGNVYFQADLASAGQCGGKHLVNSCILQGIVTAAATTECV